MKNMHSRSLVLIAGIQITSFPPANKARASMLISCKTLTIFHCAHLTDEDYKHKHT